ncbi:hypothetical protein [Ferruginibacter albus]|uniref:hypothetical protein n=1 Tax=Ferruginibacter albus TaxID=2875540 RepID=UPI001CC63014|nr:hypothetical protein [Ferruginibacter albus]UAY52300.1 hypothetical protein K9M53_01075 [Ferruginibacter albus]
MKSKFFLASIATLILAFGISTANAAPVKPPVKHGTEMRVNKKQVKKHHHKHHHRHHKGIRRVK